MRTILALLGIATIACGAAMADEITLGKLPYPNIQVMDVSNLRITYELSGRSFDKPIRELTSVTIGGMRQLNQAEVLVKEGKFAEAVAEYDKADKSEVAKPWQQRLIRYRRLAALSSARLIGRAVEDWLAVVDECATSRAAVAMAPGVPADRGSPENAKAIKLLEARLNSKDAGMQAQVKQLLSALYTQEGMEEKHEYG